MTNDDVSPSVVCALCDRGSDIAPFHLTRGIVLQLCGHHRSPAYLAKDAGRAFTDRLAARWHAHGIATENRLRALAAHRRAVSVEGAARARPGSYAWPDLRAEAETRFANGEPPAHVIRDLRAANCDGPATVPSPRTMRRWFNEGRWLRDAPRRRRGHPPRRLKLQLTREQLGQLAPFHFTNNHVWPLVEYW